VSGEGDEASAEDTADMTEATEATENENATDEETSPAFATPLERAVVPTGEGYAVVTITGITAGALGPDDALRRQAYRRQMATATAVAEADMLITQLRASTPIEVFDERL